MSGTITYTLASNTITSAQAQNGPSAADKIRTRIEEKREEYREYLAHARIRLREEDLHGLWDCGANASEVSNYIDGLQFALDAIEGK